MEEVFIRLRHFSLRWAIVIMFVTSIIAGYFELKSGGTFVITSLVMLVGSVFFYTVWSGQAIRDVKKALYTVYVLSGLLFLNIIGQWGMINEGIDFEGAINSALWGDDSLSNSIIYSRAMYHWPLKVLVSFALAATMISTIKLIDKMYRFCWIGMAVSYILNAVNLLMLATDYNYNGLEKFNSGNNLMAWLSAMLYLVLFFQGNNKNLVAPESAVTKGSSNVSTFSIEEKSKQLFKLKDLLDSGVLTKEEFEKEKSKILNK